MSTTTTAADPITAHGGGELVDLRAATADQPRLRAYAAKLPTVTLGQRELADLEMLASGAFSPLTGFMGQADYNRSRDEMRLANSVPWSIPITLGVEEAEVKKLSVGEDVALTTEDGARLATMTISEIYKVDRTKEAEAVFGTSD